MVHIEIGEAEIGVPVRISGIERRGDHLILPDEELGPLREYSGFVVNVNGTPFFLTDPASTAPLIDRPDRIPLAEARWGMFDRFDDALPDSAYATLFRIRFVGRRSPVYWRYVRPGSEPLPGKLVVDRLIALRRCPFSIDRCRAAEPD